jgi:hypothetical protein
MNIADARPVPTKSDRKRARVTGMNLIPGSCHSAL